MQNIDPKIIIALDYNNSNMAINFAKKLNPNLCKLKVGMELFTACGPKIIEKLQNFGFAIFLDLKYHDIPNQVANACKEAANLGIWMLTVHALGGEAMLTTAMNAIANCTHQPKLIAATMLTSLNDADIAQLNFVSGIQNNVLNLAKLAKQCNLDGVVCSAGNETKLLREHFHPGFILVTPGIRLTNQTHADQKRVVTPQTAINNGSSYLVIGRSITSATNPLKTLEAINHMLSEAQICPT